MKTAIDMIGTNLASGTKSYNLNFCKCLIREKINSKIYIYITKEYCKILENKNKNKNIKFLIKPNFLKNPLIKFFWMQFILPIELKIFKVNQFYAPMNYGPLFLRLFKIRFVLTLHSNLPWLYFSLMPGNFFRKILVKFFMGLSLKKCDELIVNSHFAKQEILKFNLVPKEKINVIYLGAFTQINNIDQNFTLKFFDYKNYFLSVISCVRYHNIINLLKAYKLLLSKYNHKVNFVLVMQILDYEYFKEIKNFIKKNFDDKNTIIFSDLDSKYLPKLYKNSQFYLFSSYSEVFGLTSLEAMQNDCPVLISGTSALKEINSDAAIYFDPDKIEQITDKMNEFLTDKHLISRLKNLGQRHSKKFTWEKTLSQTLKILKIK